MNFRQFFTAHAWWGKILGAFLGFLAAGPAGAFFGILIGNFFDRGLAEHLSSPYWRYHAEKHSQVQQQFFDATFRVMGHIAKSDGRVSEQEIQMAKALMESMRLSDTQKKLAVQRFNEGKKPSFHLTDTLLQLKQACQDNPELLKLFLDIQYQAAQVDYITPEKTTRLTIIFRTLGFAPLNQQHRFYEDYVFRSQKQQSNQHRSREQNSSHYQHPPRSTSSLASAYGILEIPTSANKQEVKRAYRRLMSRNHPDKLIAKGLPESMIKLANEKTQTIRKAYETICENKGW